MLRNVIAAGSSGGPVLQWIEDAALVIEIIAVAIIIVSIFYALGKYLLRAATRRQEDAWYHELKVTLGKALLLGLEVLVAADVVRTVALEATLQSVATLGLLVVVRTILSWTILVETEGHWPWQGAPSEGAPSPGHASAHENELPAGEPGQAAVINSGGM